MSAFGRLFIVFAVVLTATFAMAVNGPNAVGYVNISLRPGFNLISRPLYEQGYTVADIARSIQSTVPDGLRVYLWEGPGYRAAIYDSSSGTFQPKEVAEELITPGRGFFVYNPGTNGLTITFAGEVLQGELIQELSAGFSVIASMVPQGGTLETLAFPVEPGDIVYRFDAGLQRFVTAMFDSIDGAWLPNVPQIDTGEGFVVYKSQPAIWRRVFSVIGRNGEE